MREVYFIGGGPCCGKSTVAELLRKKHQMISYKLDNHLDDYLKTMAGRNNEVARAVRGYTVEETWMREPEVMCQEQIALYEGMLTHALKAIERLPKNKVVLAEGTGFMPHLMQKTGIKPDRYICLTPTPVFQLERYAQRSWVKHYLKATSDPDKALANWMERDLLFSLRVREDAKQMGYPGLVIDGTKPAGEVLALVEEAFRLK